MTIVSKRIFELEATLTDLNSNGITDKVENVQDNIDVLYVKLDILQEKAYTLFEIPEERYQKLLDVKEGILYEYKDSVMINDVFIDHLDESVQVILHSDYFELHKNNVLDTTESIVSDKFEDVTGDVKVGVKHFTASTPAMGISFAESSDTNYGKDEKCIRALEDASMFPDSRYTVCAAKFECNVLPSRPDEIYMLENDYTIKQYLYNYPPQIPLDERGPSMNSAGIPYSNYWSIHSESTSSPRLGISTNLCGDIERYSYYDDENGLSLRAGYSLEDFEKNIYDITKEIMQRHPTPAIQMSEFNISVNEIHCNDGLELYIRNYITPVCLKEHTYEKMLERGFNLQKTIS